MPAPPPTCALALLSLRACPPESVATAPTPTLASMPSSSACFPLLTPLHHLILHHFILCGTTPIFALTRLPAHPAQLLPLLTPLYQLIDERLSVFKPLLKLVGRMQMLQAQMASQAAASRQDGAGASDPLFTYDEAAEAAAADEGEEEEEEFDEAESDGEDEGEDDDDDLSDLDGLDEDEDEEY
eukprot:scaffold6460_cov130-Isochrysis_galbana.AAC.12